MTISIFLIMLSDTVILEWIADSPIAFDATASCGKCAVAG